MAYPSVTRAQLRAALQLRWEEDPFWTDDDANQALNDALRLWSAYTDFWWDSTTATQPANDNFVVTTSPIGVQTRVLLENVALEPTTLSDLDHGQNDWQSVRGTPVLWAPIDYASFVVYPCSATTLTNLIVEGIRETPTLTTDADVVQLGAEEQVAILDYAIHAAAFKRGASFIEATQPHFLRFQQACLLRNAQLGMSRVFQDAALRGQKELRGPNAIEDGQAPS